MTDNTAAENSDNLQDISQRFRGYYPVVVDVETAGFDPKNSALLEVAFCTLKINENGDFEKDEMFHCNIKPFPNSVIEEANIKFLGIDPFDPAREALDEKVGLLPIFKQLNKKVKKAGCKRAILVGHNAHFDHSFIMAAAERLNFKRNPFHPFTVMDTATLASLFLGHSVLSVACETAGIPFDAGSAHDAAYDTDREAELFCYFVKELRQPVPKVPAQPKKAKSAKSSFQKLYVFYRTHRKRGRRTGTFLFLSDV